MGDPITEAVVKATLGIIQLIVGIVLAMVSIYIGVKLLDRLTKGIEMQQELKKGNLAVGILMGGVILSICIVVSSGVGGLTLALTSNPGSMEGWLRAVGAGVAQVVIGLVFAVIAIYVAFNVWDRLTTDIDETEELKKGNVSIGIVMAAVLVGVSFVIQAGVSGIARAFGG